MRKTYGSWRAASLFYRASCIALATLCYGCGSPLIANASGPLAATQAPADVRTTTATLNGAAVVNGLDTLAWFEWGPRGNYDYVTTPTNLSGTNLFTRVSAPIAGLTSRGTYQYRLVLSNSDGTASGSIQLFTTGQRIRAWGDNTYGQTNVPPGLSNVVSIAAAGHSLALKADGTIAGWGGNYYGQATPPPELSNVVAVACGNAHSLALKSDGTVVAWGQNYWGQATVPPALSNVVAISAGDWHSLALKIDGSVAVWGEDNYGQTNVPAGLSNVVAIAAGNLHNLALKADGTVVAWGINVPAGLSNVVAIAAGENDGLALKANGTLLAWGDDHYGQTNVPAGLNSIVAVAGYQQSLALAPNLAPLCSSFTNSGQMNHDQLITLSAVDPNADAVTFRITSLPAQGTLYQRGADYPFQRGAPILVPDTIVSNSFGYVIFSPATNSVGRPYAGFNYVANDGQLDSLPGTVTVNVLLPAAPRFTAFALQTNGSFQVTFSGSSTAAYRVWASTNLTDWVVLGYAQQVSSAVFQFVDFSAPDLPARFYRAGAP